MKQTIFLVFLIFSIESIAMESIDIDCDGILDPINITVSDTEFSINIIASSSPKVSELTFGLGQPSRQDAICGLVPELSSSNAATEEMHQEMFGEAIEGYKYLKQCNDLVVSGGECDSITVFYNHKTGVLNWLRL
jgi:hypothetical protein